DLEPPGPPKKSAHAEGDQQERPEDGHPDPEEAHAVGQEGGPEQEEKRSDRDPAAPVPIGRGGGAHAVVGGWGTFGTAGEESARCTTCTEPTPELMSRVRMEPGTFRLSSCSSVGATPLVVCRPLIPILPIPTWASTRTC